jgi:inward rectifier potassium channel
MPWLNFIGLIVVGYFAVNLLFASLYMSIGVEHLTGMDGLSDFDKFMEAFFFSAQTITTLGYGRVAPLGTAANIIAATESMLGLLAFALATGMLYGRFSKPTAKIRYSSIAVVAPYQDINAFMFRVVNPQNNQLLEVEATVTLSLKREKSELREFHLLGLERANVIFFPSLWTIVHPITDISPLLSLNETDLFEKDVEFIIMIKAFDESSSQTVYSRSSYKPSELRWGEKFVYVNKLEKNGISIDVGRIDETEKATLKN